MFPGHRLAPKKFLFINYSFITMNGPFYFLILWRLFGKYKVSYGQF